MSTRYARTADKASNEKNAEILKSLLRMPPNKYCADCKKKDARWASWNLGIFVCIRCSGIHRSLGVHISKVKSVDLDTWVKDQVENMVRWGNERANKYWEANLGDKKPSESNMEMWIRAKYEQKRWAMKGPVPDPSTLGSNIEKEEPIQPSPKQVEKPKQKQSEFANLDAFLTTPVENNQIASTASSQLQGADFFFGSSESSTQTPTQQSSPPQHQQQQQKHNDIKSSILSLYNTVPAAQTPPIQQNQQQFFTGNTQNQLSGLNFGYNQSPQLNNNVWGSFASPAPANNNSNLGSFTSSGSQSNLPQGGQFFSAKIAANPVPKEPKKDVFADLLG